MLGLVEYNVISQEILGLAEAAQNNVASKLDPDMTKQQSIKIAKKEMFSYYDDYQTSLKDGLNDIATNAIEHYAGQTTTDVPKGLAEKVVGQIYEERYFGASLITRLAVNRKRLERTVTQSAQVSQAALSGVLTESVPFGAHYGIDKRVLLASSERAEQLTAQYFASQEEHPFLRWNVSDRHKGPDTCDDLANNIDKLVVAYLKEHNLDIDPKGLYFQDQIPHPPHPNCQCEFGLVSSDKDVSKNIVKRTTGAISKLLRRFRSK